MILRRALLAIVALLAALSPANADFTFTPGTGATAFSFTSTTGGTALCAAASTHCFASVPINTAGAQLFTSGAPGLVTLTGTNNINNIAGTVSLPTGAATQTTLASVLTALGSPFQAGGSIGNTSFAVTNAGTFAVQVSNANGNGQATMANSLPVVIASNQSAVPVTLTSTTITGTVAATQSGTWTTGQTSQYPAGATAITISATGTTGATTATLAGTSGKTTYMCWSSVRANATATANVQNTITGVITGTLTRQFWVPANTAGLGVDEMIYNPCVPASATNTGIAVVSGAPGTGGNVTVNAGGYQL